MDRRERPVRRAGGAREARERAQHALPAQRPSSPPVPPQGAPGGSGRPSTPRERPAPPGAQPRPRLLEPAATEAADSTAFWSTQARRRVPSSTPSRTSTTRSASTSASPSARPRECGCCRAFACVVVVSRETELMFGVSVIWEGTHTDRSICGPSLPEPAPRQLATSLSRVACGAYIRYTRRDTSLCVRDTDSDTFRAVSACRVSVWHRRRLSRFGLIHKKSTFANVHVQRYKFQEVCAS